MRDRVKRYSRRLAFATLLILILLPLTLGTPRLTSTAARQTLVDNFEVVSAPASWTLTSGAEFPGAIGTLTIGAGHDSERGARLTYDFSQGGSYVGAELQLARPLAAATVAFWIKSPPDIQVVVRVVDESGQTLQYHPPRPAETFDAATWHHQTVDLTQPTGCWGGADDGVLHGTLQRISILAADHRKPGAVGVLEFDDVAVSDQVIINLDPLTMPLVPVPSESAELNSRLGVNIHFTHDAAALDIAHAIGFTWVRMDLPWIEIETVPGVYDFAAHDQLIADLDARGMRALFILDYGNPLYTGSERTPPATPAAREAFGRFAEAAARHFAGHGVSYEIWNEPNVGFFWPPQPSAVQYAALLDEVTVHLRAGDPQARIVTGGLSCGDFAFLRSFLAEIETTGVTAIGFHPYRATAPETLIGELAVWRSIVSQTAASNLPTWDTEWGYSSTWFGNGHAPEARARHAVMVARELLTSWSAGFPLIIYYDLRDDGTDPNDAEHNFGLLARDGTAKPAMQAVHTLTTAASQRQLRGLLSINLPNVLHALRLDGSTDSVVVLWASSGQATVRVPARVTAVDALGEPLALRSVGRQ
ncbi:MAG TPA: hypothetical protein VLG46_09845, partial [Anaerolineae bacterium]|nr:hypothetical protein [Anaerolineae bacterium]